MKKLNRLKLATLVISAMASSLAVAGPIGIGDSGTISFSGDISATSCVVSIANTTHNIAVETRQLGLGTVNTELAMITSPVSLANCPDSVIEMAVESIQGTVNASNVTDGVFAERRVGVYQMAMNLTANNFSGLTVKDKDTNSLINGTTKLTLNGSKTYLLETDGGDSPSFDLNLRVWSRGQNTYQTPGDFTGGYTYSFTYI